MSAAASVSGTTTIIGQQPETLPYVLRLRSRDESSRLRMMQQTATEITGAVQELGSLLQNSTDLNEEERKEATTLQARQLELLAQVVEYVSELRGDLTLRLGGNSVRRLAEFFDSASVNKELCGFHTQLADVSARSDSLAGKMKAAKEKASTSVKKQIATVLAVIGGGLGILGIIAAAGGLSVAAGAGIYALFAGSAGSAGTVASAAGVATGVGFGATAVGGGLFAVADKLDGEERFAKLAKLFADMADRCRALVVNIAELNGKIKSLVKNLRPGDPDELPLELKDIVKACISDCDKIIALAKSGTPLSS